MVVDAETRREIERQAKIFDAAKKEAILKIQDKVRMATEKLRAAERVLLDEVEIEFSENPFEGLLAKIDSGNPPTDTEMKRILNRGVPKVLGRVRNLYVLFSRKSRLSSCGG